MSDETAVAVMSPETLAVAKKAVQYPGEEGRRLRMVARVMSRAMSIMKAECKCRPACYCERCSAWKHAEAVVTTIMETTEGQD